MYWAFVFFAVAAAAAPFAVAAPLASGAALLVTAVFAGLSLVTFAGSALLRR